MMNDYKFIAIYI